MRIISDFRDYYDTALGYGVDPNVVYRRSTRVAPARDLGLPRTFGFLPITLSRHEPQLEAGLWLLAFCGASRPLVVVTAWTKDERVVLRYCWFPDDVEEALQDYPDVLRVFTGRRRSRLYRPFTRARVSELFAAKLPESEVDSLHRGAISPVLLVRPSASSYRWARRPEVVIDPVLRDLDFVRVVDPFTAFQEISMYLGGVLGMPEKTHDPIPDEALRDMKGFDDMSFKTVSPGERKRRRREKRRE